MNKKIVLFLNGPPRSGKDTIAAALAREFSACVFKFADPLYLALEVLSGMTRERLEQQKDVLIPGTNRTIRHLLIELSENIVKPNLGKDHFGLQTASGIAATSASLSVISDAGFPCEVQACVDALSKEYECWLWRVHRPHCTFDGDSRSWIQDIEGIEGNSVIFNGTTPEGLEEIAIARMRRIIRGIK